MNVIVILMRFDSASMLAEGIFASGFIRTLFYHFNTHVYRVVSDGWGERRVYGEMDYYSDEIKNGGEKSDLWLIHYLLTEFPPPARFCLRDPSSL